MKLKRMLRLLFLLSVFLITDFHAQQAVDFVTYGLNGNPKEGDNDSKQIFFIQVDKDYNDSLVVELFDADCQGNIDKAFRKKFNSQFRFSIYGGIKDSSKKFIVDSYPVYKCFRNGKLIKEIFVSDDSSYDNHWVKFVQLDKNSGEFSNGAYYFKLLVEGISGDDANIFNIRVLSNDENKIKIFNYEPTIHLLPKMEMVQLRFNSGENASLIIKNYDADNAKISLATPYRKNIRLTSSGDGNWKSNKIPLRPFEYNEVCAIQFGPGGRSSNDAVFAIDTEDGRSIPITLPITTRIKNIKPVIVKEIKHSNEDCNTVIFDASKSYGKKNEKINVKWILPDGTVRENMREEVTFDKAGKYPIILAIRDNSKVIEGGVYEKFYVTINKLPKAVAGKNIVSSPNQKVYFNGKASYDKDGRITAYNWDFGDGTNGIGKVTAHRYETPGLYTVKLTVTDNYKENCNTNTDSLKVTINAAPLPLAGDDVHCSINETVEFDGSKSRDTDGKIISYEWNFGDGKKDNKVITSHQYRKAGKYNVVLKVTDDSNVRNKTAKDKLVVWVNSPPKAKAGKDCEIAVNQMLKLDASKSYDRDGEIVEYLWTCANQFEKNGKTVQHTFTTPGKYKIKLLVKDNSGTTTNSSEDEITVVVNAQPIANAGVDIFQTNSLVQFDASASSDADGKIIRYTWNFGDGSSSKLKAPKHYYKNSGEYNVTLTVKDNSPASNNKVECKIKVKINAKPIADAGADIVVAPNEMFNLSSQNSIDADGKIDLTEWKLENKIISTNETFDYSISKHGKYIVQLKVADNSGDADAIDYDNLSVKVNSAPVIKVDKEYSEIAVGETAIVDASNSYDADGSITSYEWLLDNKVISTNPKFTYTFKLPGVKKIKLRITDDENVSNSITEKEITVFVNSSPEINYLSSINTCNNLVTLSASKAYDKDGDTMSFMWNLGDGQTSYGRSVTHRYSASGSYPVVLTVDDGHNLTNSVAVKQIEVKINSVPVANAGEDELICTGDVVILDASESFDADGDLLKYEWDFGDSTTATGVTVDKVYPLPGLYEVKLKVSDNSLLECNSSYDTKILKVVDSPVAFAGEDILACSHEEVFFNAFKSTDSDGIVNTFSWDFGDGTTGGGEKTSHVYKEPGVYTVILTITGEETKECDNQDTDELIVTVEEAPLADFTYTDSVAVNSNVSFNALLSDGKGSNITSYNWDFGDSTTVIDKEVSHKYKKSGNYIVALTIKTDSKASCNSSTTKKAIYVNVKPVASITCEKLDVNPYDRVEFSASNSHDPNGKITKYIWDFGDGTSEEGINVLHSYAEAGKYKVVLTVKDDTNLKNCSAKDSINIEVSTSPSGEIILPKYGYAKKPISFKVKSQSNNIKSVAWAIDGKKYTSKEITHTFKKAGKYDVVCRILDDTNLSTELTNSIIVYELPELSVLAPHTVCLNKNVKLAASYTTKNPELKGKVEWVLPDGNIIAKNKIRTKFKTSGKQKVIAKVINLENDSDILTQKEISIYVNEPPVAKIADITDAYVGGANDNILFDASESYDPDGNPLTYKWNFGDGDIAEGVKVFHTYMKAGKYRVTLTVTDNKNCNCNSASTMKIVRVIKRK